MVSAGGNHSNGVADQIIECIDRNQGVNTIAMITRASPTDSKAGVGVNKGVTQAGDGVRRDTGLLGHPVRRVLCKYCCPVFAIVSVVVTPGDNVVGQPQDQNTLRAGSGGNPLICCSTAQGHSWFDLNKPSPDIGPALTAVSKAETVMHRGNPISEVIGSEGQQIAGVFQIVIRQALHAKKSFVGRIQSMRMVKIVVQQALGTQLLHKEFE